MSLGSFTHENGGAVILLKQSFMSWAKGRLVWTGGQNPTGTEYRQENRQVEGEKKRGEALIQMTYSTTLISSPSLSANDEWLQ